MAADTERPRLTGEFLDRIRARLVARANLGTDPTDPAFLDTIPGSIYGDLEGPGALEIDEFYDFAEIVARAVIPSTSFGEWLDDWAESLGLERLDEAPAGGTLLFSGTPGTDVGAGQQVTTIAAPDGEPIAFQVSAGGTIDGGGTVELDAVAVVAGSDGNVSAATVVRLSPEVDGVTDVTNPDAMTGGADVESDERLSFRVSQALGGDVGAGTQADYVRWGLAQPGVGHVTVRPVARGAGTVDVYITDLNNDPMPGAAVDAFQAILCPEPFMGLGLAPINHDALVLTPDSTAVLIAAEVQPDAGYSLDGTGGTTALRALVEASLARYVNGLDVGEDVVRSKVIAAIVDVPGVADVADLEINGDAAAAAIAIAADHVASLTQPSTLTEP